MKSTLSLTLLILTAGHCLGQECVDDTRRAGWPLTISPLAMPSNTRGYLGHLVGGGCARMHKAEGPTPDEGTWGWDYSGLFLRRRVDLGWWHGRRSQGGTGAYRTDGPRVLPSLEESQH